MQTVIVGMSGGVDSSVSAFLLKQQGYRVIGMFMKNWDEKDAAGNCPAAQELEDVIRVCTHLDIPYYSVNFVKEYWDNVFTHFLEDYRAGFTPNPDILCNREIKFKVLLEKALELGADFLATGHYCQTRDLETGDRQLLRGLDPGKDQSYFLHAVTEKALKKVLFPVGGMPKKEVREIARQNGIPTAEKKDSTGICFIGKRDFKEFLSNYLPITPGNFEDLEGNVVGKHDGIAYYTIGQRKGMGIGGPGEAWFVIDKDIERNVVILAQGTDHPNLFSSHAVATELTWISGREPALPFNCTAKVRYRQPDQPCTITRIEEGKAFITFHVPQRAVTPGQAIVFYDGEACLGGGRIIQRSE
jgi:tRNA-specific 2-thiouridylase